MRRPGTGSGRPPPVPAQCSLDSRPSSSRWGTQDASALASQIGSSSSSALKPRSSSAIAAISGRRPRSRQLPDSQQEQPDGEDRGLRARERRRIQDPRGQLAVHDLLLQRIQVPELDRGLPFEPPLEFQPAEPLQDLAKEIRRLREAGLVPIQSREVVLDMDDPELGLEILGIDLGDLLAVTLRLFQVFARQLRIMLMQIDHRHIVRA